MERYIFVHEYTKGQRIAVSIEGEISLQLLDALEGYVRRHKALIAAETGAVPGATGWSSDD